MGARIANLSTEWIIAIIVALAVVRVLLWKTDWHPGWLSKDNARAIGELIESALVALVLVFGLIRPLVVQAFFIPSESMVPTLRIGDRLLVNKFLYRFRAPRRGDVIVFIAPPSAEQFPTDRGPEDFIKRVVAVEGDLVEIYNHHVYVNNRMVDEPYIAESPDYAIYPPIEVPKGQLFVLGDNRNHSNDSHVWGFLERNRVVGKAMVIFWPPARAGIIR